MRRAWAPAFAGVTVECVAAFCVKLRVCAWTPPDAAGGSRDDVGEELVLDDGDLVFQGELLFLEPLDHQLIGAARAFERDDLVVEAAVLGAQARKLLT